MTYGVQDTRIEQDSGFQTGGKLKGDNGPSLKVIFKKRVGVGEAQKGDRT